MCHLNVSSNTDSQAWFDLLLCQGLVLKCSCSYLTLHIVACQPGYNACHCERTDCSNCAVLSGIQIFLLLPSLISLFLHFFYSLIVSFFILFSVSFYLLSLNSLSVSFLFLLGKQCRSYTISSLVEH